MEKELPSTSKATNLASDESQYSESGSSRYSEAAGYNFHDVHAIYMNQSPQADTSTFTDTPRSQTNSDVVKMQKTCKASPKLGIGSVEESDDDDDQGKSLYEMGHNSTKIAGWDCHVKTSKEPVFKLIMDTIRTNKKPTVRIIIGNHEFRCQMIVLQCYSEYFMDRSSEKTITLPEEEVTSSAFSMMLNWMLTEHAMVQRQGIIDLLRAATFLKVKNLVKQCWSCLEDNSKFTEDAAFVVYLEAQKRSLDNLERLMFGRISRFFLTLVASADFLELNSNEICTLFKSNNIGVNTEIEVFMAAVRWLKHDWEVRKAKTVHVMKHVRFGLMPPWYLVSLKNGTATEEINRIVNNTALNKMIDDGISYTTTQISYRDKPKELSGILKTYNLVSPCQRVWILDRKCPYHRRIDSAEMEHISFETFLNYLRLLRNAGKKHWRTLEITQPGVAKTQGQGSAVASFN